MIRHLTLEQVLRLHERTLQKHGGLPGLRDEGLLLSAIAQTSGQFTGVDYYPTVEEKAAALTFSLVRNHAFNDGNKRAGFLAMLLFLRLNGYRFQTDADENERAILELAAGKMTREELIAWITGRMIAVSVGKP